MAKKEPFNPEAHGPIIRLSIEKSRPEADKELGQNPGYANKIWATYPKESRAILDKMAADGNERAKAKAKQMDAQKAGRSKRLRDAKKAAAAKAAAPAKKAPAKKTAAPAKKAAPASATVPETPKAAPVESRPLMQRIQSLELDIIELKKAIGL